MTGIRIAFLFSMFLLIAVSFAPISAAGEPMGVLIVGRDDGDTEQMELESQLKSLVKNERTIVELTPGQLPIFVYHFNYDDQKKYCVETLGIKERDLLFAGVVRLDREGYPDKVLSRATGITDTHSAASSLVNSALELMGRPIKGDLHIFTDPPGALVVLQGEPRGITPLTLQGLKRGEYSITLRLQGYLDMNRTLTIVPGAGNELRTALEPREKFGSLLVRSNPPGAQIYVDGELKGSGNAQGLLIPKLREGTHEVIGRLEGHEDWRTSVNITPDTRQDVAMTLRKRTGFTDWLRQGDESASAGDLDEALKAYEEALALEPDSFDAHVRTARVYGKKKMTRKAVEHFNRALSSRPDDGQVNFELGFLYSTMGRYDDAERHLSRAVRADPLNHEALSALGEIALKRGRADEAVQYLRRATSIKPDDANTRFLLGQALVEKGSHDEALGEFKEAARLKPDFALAHYALGALYMGRNMFQEAQEELVKAVDLKPDFAQGHKTLGVLYRRTQRPEKALEEFGLAVKHNPKNHSAWFEMGNTHFVMRNYDSAIEAYLKVIEIEPSFSNAYFNLGLVYRNKRMVREAKESLMKFIDLAQNDPDKQEAVKRARKIIERMDKPRNGPERDRP